MTSRRAIQRLLADMLRDIRRAEAYREGRTRDEFARDGLRRDATEQCLARIRAAACRVRDLDASAYRRISASSALLHCTDPGNSLSRLDSDVLWGVVDLCGADLRRSVADALGASMAR